MKKWPAMFGPFVKSGFQVFVLAIVQLFAFVLAAQLAGISNQPATSPTVSAETRTTAEQITTPVTPRGESVGNSSKSTSALQADQARMFGFAALVCLLNASAMVFWIQRCTLSGFGLIAAVFVVFFNCLTIMPQSDTFLFLRDSESIIRTAAVMGFCVSLVFAMATVPVFWRWRNRKIASASKLLEGLTMSGFFWRLMLCSVGYLVLYVVFGYYVAWQNPELRALYGGDENQLLGFWERVLTPPTSNRVIPFQFLRGIAWTILCLGMIRFSVGSRWSLAIVIGLVLAVVMNAQLLFPNPIMSENVRLTHLFETATSNFLFGFFCVWVLTWKPTSR